MFTRRSPCRCCTRIATSIIAQGVQNIDWIPKTDPEPTGPFDIVQPVLQSPADSGDDWSVKSWLVTLDVRRVSSEFDFSLLVNLCCGPVHFSACVCLCSHECV